ncbi:hypothetical protein, partial [Limosilactobacillus caecicola]|uniref:hypothetical protein n=1 Tax=Limosilactobacillus caecicola TaxID=2941332 RepID=UPI00203ABD0B
GGVVNGLSLTELSREGLVFLNGSKYYGTPEENGYQYIKLGNVKLVLLHFVLKTPGNNGETTKEILEVPDIIKPLEAVVATQTWGSNTPSFINYYLLQNGHIEMHTSVTIDGDTSAHYATFLYLAQG